MRNATGADFSAYKKTTLLRRIRRRMALQHIADLERYVDLLERDPAEVNALHGDLLINVTSFFRDPELFEVLCSEVLPRVVAGRAADAPVRL